MTLRRASSLAQFRRAPEGRFLVGESWIHFCAHPGLWGAILFGRPDRDDATRLAASLAVELEPGAARHGSYVDALRLDGVDPGAYAVLIEHTRRHYDASKRQFTRLALVCPPGVEGAIVAGFYGALEPPCPTSAFNRAGDALAWLGEADASLAGELQAIFAEVRGTPPLVDALRALLREQLGSPDRAAICRTLGLSERTLQRRLRQAGTSFHKQLQGARLDEAERRLRESDDPLTVVALESGFSTAQHFATLFRRATGASPSEWRARRRPAT